MSTRIALSTVQHVLTTAARLDLKLPKEIAAEAQGLLDLEHKVRGYARNAMHVNVAHSILDSLAADIDPYDDPIVHEALRHAEVASRSDSVAHACYARAEAFLAQQAADILGAFKPCIARANDILQAAFAQLGDVDLEDAKSILSQGGNAAQMWSDIQRTENALGQVLTLRTYLQGVQGSGIKNPGQYRALVLAAIPPATFLEKFISAPMPSGWTLVREGLTLSLASPTEFGNRVEAINGERGQLEARQKQAFTDAFKRTHGMGVPATSS